MKNMKTALIALTMLLTAACTKAPEAEQTTTTRTTTTETSANKTTAEKAFDAGLRAKQKAEAIKAEQDKKAQETDTASGNE